MLEDEGYHPRVAADSRRERSSIAWCCTAPFIPRTLPRASIPAILAVSRDTFIIFSSNAFAILGLRALYFVLAHALEKLRHLNHGLGIILAFIGVKLVLHWAHDVWAWVPEVPTLLSLGVIVAILATVTTTSIIANRRDARRQLAEVAEPGAAEVGRDRAEV